MKPIPFPSRLCYIPLDSRPVCYDLPIRLAESAGIELDMPAKNLLGHLKTPANFPALKRWMKNHLFELAPIVVALDTLAYGGLIPSRLGNELEDELQKRIDLFFHSAQSPRVFAFSSIMRIPNYNLAEEEPDYWSEYGQALYQYSVEHHEHAAANVLPLDFP